MPVLSVSPGILVPLPHRNPSAIAPLPVRFSRQPLRRHPTRHHPPPPTKSRVECSSGIQRPAPLTVGSHYALLRNANAEQSRLSRHDRSYPPLHFTHPPARELRAGESRPDSPRDFLSLSLPILLALFHGRNSRNWESRRRNRRAYVILRYWK